MGMQIKTLAALAITGSETGFIASLSTTPMGRRSQGKLRAYCGMRWRRCGEWNRPEDRLDGSRKQIRPCGESERQPPLPGLGVRPLQHPACRLYVTCLLY